MPPPSPQPCHPGPCSSERDRTKMNGKKKRWGGMEMGTKQASFPGVGAGLGPPPGRVGLGANIGAWGGGGHSGRGGPGPGRQTPGLPSLPCSERAHQPLPVAPSVCTLDFSLSVHLVPNAVWGWCRWGGVSGSHPRPHGMDLSVQLWFCAVAVPSGRTQPLVPSLL